MHFQILNTNCTTLNSEQYLSTIVLNLAKSIAVVYTIYFTTHISSTIAIINAKF